MKILNLNKMKLLKFFFIILLPVIAVSCVDESVNDYSDDNYSDLIPDSVNFGQITVYNGFKQQIEAFDQIPIDSSKIIEDLYYRHKVMWDSCYGVIFGGENADKFQTSEGMLAWNQQLFRQDRNKIDSILNIIKSYNIDSLFRFHNSRFKELGFDTPSARITIAFTPFPGIGFGGCENDQFILELNNPEFELIYTLEKGLPHEIYHFINEENLGEVKNFSAMDLAINEGLACHFTEYYFGDEISKYEAVENMSKSDWQYYLDREKEIFQTMEPYFLIHRVIIHC